MAAFELAAALGIVVGLGVAAWMTVPGLLASTADPETPEPDVLAVGDVAQRLDALAERVRRDDDDGRPWSRHPLAGDGERLPSSLSPARRLAIASGHLLPLHAALLTIVDGPDVVTGRRQGRPIHAVRLHDDVYLDLVEALRLVPVVALELEARDLGADVELVSAGSLPAELPVIGTWLMTGEGPRITTEASGARTFRMVLAGHALTATVWMPAVAAGIAMDALRWAGEITLGGERCTGATPGDLLEGLDTTPSAPIGWTRAELLELAAVLHQLESQEVDTSPLLLEVFADRLAPMPDLREERSALVTAAVLNWVGAAHRRAGRPREALAALDAALTVSSPLDDDNRGDIQHNRGLAWLDLHDDDPTALEAALAAFTTSARLHPADADPWIHLALIHHLRDEPAAATEAWLQAASRAPDSDHQTLFRANAGVRGPTG